MATPLFHTPSTAVTHSNAMLVDRLHPRRTDVEQFICQKYWFSFAACLSQLPEHLLCLTTDAGEIVAACAVTPAAERPLFSERYLTTPVERQLSETFQTPVHRRQIAEVGALACRDFSWLPVLFASVVDCAELLAIPYLLFTATAQLRRHLQRFHLPTAIIAEAPAVALPESERQQWGSYYQRHPLVLAGRTADGHPLQLSMQQRLSPVQWQGEVK
ncbi:thermostable hemolysin [Pseudidiomarina sediminum]|uniref:thermostable hemolysin n=1 Tax=Pseudidiomarina sediminum TaxID=431675 RepID=UPI001C98C576|nr:thermostable hemolysin [Pseudidiomarina sediminum]MBY6064468.1 thermostable hemolysin [Pseudidiomarina sediminum]